MPAQKYYAVDAGDTGSTPPTNGPTATGSAVWPNGTDNTPAASGLIHLQLETPGTYTGARLFNNSRTSLAQTARQSARLGYMWIPLNAGTVPAGTYRLQALVSEGNAAANTFLGLSIYVWRPSTTSVVGRVYDSTAELGTEFPTTAAEITWSVTGSAVTCQSGDYLIVEIWLTAAQGMATAYANTFRADFPQTGEDDFFETPDVLPPPPITGTATAASDGGGVTASGRSNPGGAGTAASDGGGVTASGTARYTGTGTAASDGGGVTASAAVRMSGTGTAASDGGGVTSTVAIRVKGTSTAASDGGGVTSAATLRSAGTGSAASDGGGVAASATQRNTGTATAASDGGGVTASVTVRMSGTGTAASDGGGVLADGTIVSGTSVSVPSSALALLVGTTSVSAGAATVATPPAALRLLGIAPAVVPSVTLAASPVAVVLSAVPPTIAGGQSVDVPMVTVRDGALAPAVTAGVAPVALSPASVFYYSIPPAVQAYQLVPAATLWLNARAPSVTGGGGTGLLVIPRRSGEGMGSLTAQD